MQQRLTIVISLPVESAKDARTIYDQIKHVAKILPEVTMTGNVMTPFEPCCGEIADRPRKKEPQ